MNTRSRRSQADIPPEYDGRRPTGKQGDNRRSRNLLSYLGKPSGWRSASRIRTSGSTPPHNIGASPSASSCLIAMRWAIRASLLARCLSPLSRSLRRRQRDPGDGCGELPSLVPEEV